MKDFSKQSELQQVNEQAKQIWQQFNDKMCSLTVTMPQTRNDRLTENGASPLTLQEKQAGTRIANWWRKIRNSGQTIALNSSGAHPPEFHTLLNNQSIQKRLSHDTDQQLLKEITTAPWQSSLFREERMQHSALNLFAAGKITWQQKATFSLINETRQCYGEFDAIPLLDEQGQDFSVDALKYLSPFLKYTPFNYEASFDPKDGYLTDKEIMLFLALVRQLPKSEQFIFLFKEQHRNNDNQGHPSPDNLLRETHSRYIEREDSNYNGILFLSHGVRNAIGLAHYSVKNWTPVIPRLGAQTIDDVEFFLKKGARVAVSGDSRVLGLVDMMMNVHGLPMCYPDNFTHDEYHSLVASRLGTNALQGIDRIIELARRRFNKRWSKDLWLLRDADFTFPGDYQEDMDTPRAITERFAKGLTSHYHVKGYLDDCDDVVKNTMDGKPFLFGTDNYPNQILLNFVIDLVRNPDEWQKLDISTGDYPNQFILPILIKMARFLNEQGIFEEDQGDNQQHKLNILRFDCFMRSYDPPFVEIDGSREWIDWKAPKKIPEELMKKMRAIAQESDQYQVKLRNKSLIFGFVKGAASNPPKQKPRDNKRERESNLTEVNPTHETQLKKMFIDACHEENLTDMEHFLDNHLELLDFDLFDQASVLVKTPNAAELLFTKSGYNKYPKNDKGEPVLPHLITKGEKRERESADNDVFFADDGYLRQENRLLQQQVASLQELADLRLARIIELEETLQNKAEPKRKKNTM